MWLVAPLALAGTFPVAVRLQGQDLSAPVVLLTADGKEVEVKVNDEGKPPDQAAGDNLYTGVVQLNADGVSVTVRTGAGSSATAAVRFEGPPGPHDIDLSLQGGALTAVASSPGDLPPTPIPGPDAPAPGAPVPGGAGGPDAFSRPPDPQPASPGAPGGGGGAGARPAFPPAQGSGRLDVGLWLIAAGVGLFVLLGGAWWRLRRREEGDLPPGVTRIPEPGVVDPALPSLSDGLSVWVAEGDASGILPHLLRHLADDHEVVVAAPAAMAIPQVGGGRCHRVGSLKATTTGDAAEHVHLRTGGRAAVLILPERATANQLRDYRDLLPQDVGAIVLLSEPVDQPFPTVRVTTRAPGWVLTHGDVAVQVQADPRGLAVLRSPVGP